jgi:hypothetical protein
MLCNVSGLGCPVSRPITRQLDRLDTGNIRKAARINVLSGKESSL